LIGVLVGVKLMFTGWMLVAIGGTARAVASSMEA
jgi:microcompartment protein CcmL/EutN